MEKTRRRKEHMKFKKRGTIILKMDQITQVLYSHSDMWNIPNIYHVFIVQRGGDIMLHNSVSVPRDLHVRTKCVPRYTFFCTWLSGCVTWTAPVRDWLLLYVTGLLNTALWVCVCYILTTTMYFLLKLKFYRLTSVLLSTGSSLLHSCTAECGYMPSICTVQYVLVWSGMFWYVLVCSYCSC